MKKKLKKFFQGNRLCYLIFFIICCILLHSYFWSGTGLNPGDDTLFHLSNIEVIESTLDFSKLQFFPSQILPEIANNLGYGVGLFYPRLPHLVAAYITHILSPFGANAAIGLKVTHFLILFLSMVVMCQFTYKVWKNKKVSFYSSVFYATSAYMMSDIIIRDAYAECFQFLFLPMILIGLYELFYGEKKKFYPWFIIGYLGMLNSHLVVSIFLTSAIIIFLLFHLKETFTWTNFKRLLIASGIILILFIPSVIPMIEHKLFGNYAVFQENLMSSVGLVKACAISPLAYLIPFYRWENIHFFINIVVIILMIIVFLKRKKIFKTPAQKKLFVSLTTIGFIFLILTTKLTPWQYAPDFLLMIQFPWRLEIIVVLVAAFLASAYFVLPEKKNQKAIDIMILTAVLAFGMIATIPNKKLLTPEYLDNLHVSQYGLGWSKEYLPQQMHKNGLHYLYQKNEIKTLDHPIEVSEEQNEIPNYSFQIKVSEPTRIEIPRIYYLGYYVELKTDDGKTKRLDYQESEHGMIEFEVPTSGTITITYPGTKAYQISNIIRTSVILIGVGGIFLYITKKDSSKK